MSHKTLHQDNLEAINQALIGYRAVWPYEDEDTGEWFIVTVPVYLDEKDLFKGIYLIIQSGFRSSMDAEEFISFLKLKRASRRPSD